MASSAASGASGNSNSMESLNEEVHLMERAEQSHENDPNSAEMGAAYNTPEKAESPIYAVIEDIIPSSKEKKEDVPSTENNVWMLL